MKKPRIQIGFAVVAMATLFPMTAFPQTNQGAKEATALVAEIDAANTQQSSAENNTNSGFPKNSDFQTLPNIDTNFKVEVQTRFNEIRRELLDERASFIDRWLAVIGIILTFFGVVVVIAGFLGFKKFREIEEEAKTNAKIVTDAKEAAERILSDIRKKRDEATAMVKELDATSADTNTEEVTQVVANIRDNPDASLVDKAIADALALQQKGKQKDAIKKWRAIAEITEESDNALAARAWFSIGFLISVENSSKKIYSYGRAIQLKPDMPVAYYNRGNAKRRLSRHEDAITDYDKAIQLDPDYARAYSNRGISKSNLEHHEDAITDYDKAIQLNPDYARAYYNRGNAKRRLSRHEDAITDFDKAIQLDPDYARAYYNRGNAKRRLSRHEDAITDYDKAIQLDPDYARAYYNRGNAKRRLGRHEDAITDFDKAIQLNPDYARAYFNRGISKSNLGHHQDAITDFDKAIQLSPEFAEAFFNRGNSKYELGFKVESKSDLETALGLARNSDNLDLINLVEQNLHSLSAINGE